MPDDRYISLGRFLRQREINHKTGRRHADAGLYGPVVMFGKRKHLVVAELKHRGLMSDDDDHFARRLAVRILENYRRNPDDAISALARIIATLESYRHLSPRPTTLPPAAENSATSTRECSGDDQHIPKL